MRKRFCDKCIAEKVVTGDVMPMAQYYPRGQAEHWADRKDGKCSLCGEDASVSLYTPMEKFLPKKDEIDEKNAIPPTVEPNKISHSGIGIKICELLNTINLAESMDCTCDKAQLARGLACGCQRGMSIRNAGIELGEYLRKLRGELK